MNTKSPCALALAFLLSLTIAIPAELSAEPQGSGQHAGDIARVIPAVSIARGSKTLNASVKTAVDWQDVVNTKADGRARIALEDGSVLNVGSDSSIKVVKHDAGAQQTDLELAYGKLRTQAQKISKPDGKFEVHTAAGVAGVVGTDFYASFDNNVMTVIAYEGKVKVCNLAGVCVLLQAGQMTSLRSNDNSAPADPTQAPLNLLVTASKDTSVETLPGKGIETGGGGKAWGITIGIIAVVPIIVFGVLSTRNSKAPTPLTPCQINPSNCG
jgi:hypothetical protein